MSQTLAKWLFWLAAVSLAGQLLMGTGPATLLFTVLLMAPYIVLKLREGYEEADEGPEEADAPDDGGDAGQRGDAS